MQDSMMFQKCMPCLHGSLTAIQNEKLEEACRMLVDKILQFNKWKHCSCCARHQHSRPLEISDPVFTQPVCLSSSEMKPDLLRGNEAQECLCPCRHEMRWICRSFAFVLRDMSWTPP